MLMQDPNSEELPQGQAWGAASTPQLVGEKWLQGKATVAEGLERYPASEPSGIVATHTSEKLPTTAVSQKQQDLHNSSSAANSEPNIFQ